MPLSSMRLPWWPSNSFDSGSRARLNASSVFVPESSEQVATGVKIKEKFGRKFAVRGNGYTSHPRMAGIEDGILFSLDKMNEITPASS